MNEFDFCPVLLEMLRSRRVTGKNGKIFEELDALSSCNNLLTLRQLMLILKPVRTLEIGLGFGGSALVFAASHRDLGHAPSNQHMAIDPFQTTNWDSSALVLLEQAGLSDYINFRSISSAFELPQMVERGERFGLAYIDGSHLFEDVFVDAYFVVRLLGEGGVVAFDDSTNPHIAKVIRFVRSNLAGSLEEFDLSKYRPVSKSGFSYRVARWLGKVQLTAFQKIGSSERAWTAPFRQF